jgi:hypothetical protein
MSYNDFNRRARIDITIGISGSGQFLPYGNAVPANWTLQGNVTAQQPQDELTIKEETCWAPYSTQKQFRTFGGGGSGGNTSGTVNTGQIASLPYATFGNSPSSSRGDWTVNESPVLTNGGYADDELIEFGYYVVAQPYDKTIDDPIDISPAIDFVARVYPGDLVYTRGSGEFTRWYVVPQNRFPQVDRTFFWTPNTSPVLASGGIADGVLVKPGTIMLPTANFFIENYFANAIDGMYYFYANQGVIFDGQRWRQNLPPPRIYSPQVGPKEFRQVNTEYISDQLYERLLEYKHREKPFVTSYTPINDDEPVTLTVNFEGQQPEVTNLKFRWTVPGNLIEDNIQPAIPGIYNFGDAWSAYHLANVAWLSERFPGSQGTSFGLSSDNDPEIGLTLYVDIFEDGNITQIVNTIEDGDGKTLTNTFTITLGVVTSQA